MLSTISVPLDSSTGAGSQIDERGRAERMFLEYLPLIDTVIAAICSRRVRPGDRDDFRSLALCKLIENDYDVLRRFAGRSSLRTYLTVVFERVLLDERVRAWGKWRPSSEARRLGPSAVRLEQLLTRDGLTRDEALQVMRPAGGGCESAAWLHRLADRLPDRVRRRIESDEGLADTPDAQPLPDAQLARTEREKRGGQVRLALRRAFSSIAVEDQLLIRLRFTDGLTVIEIARVLSIDPKQLYRRIPRILARLRQLLETAGVTEEVAQDLGSDCWSDVPDAMP